MYSCCIASGWVLCAEQRFDAEARIVLGLVLRQRRRRGLRRLCGQRGQMSWLQGLQVLQWLQFYHSAAIAAVVRAASLVRQALRVVQAVAADSDHIDGRLILLVQFQLDVVVVDVVPVRGQIVGAQLLHIHVESLEPQLARLPLDRLGHALAALCAARGDWSLIWA